jgi:hypothetical protein
MSKNNYSNLTKEEAEKLLRGIDRIPLDRGQHPPQELTHTKLINRLAYNPGNRHNVAGTTMFEYEENHAKYMKNKAESNEILDSFKALREEMRKRNGK